MGLLFLFFSKYITEFNEIFFAAEENPWFPLVADRV